MIDRANRDLFLAEGPTMWLRLMPTLETGRAWRSAELRAAATSPSTLLMPIHEMAGGYGYIRAADGFGVYAAEAGTPDVTHWIAFLFETGEVWTVDSYRVGSTDSLRPSAIPLDENAFGKALDKYSAVLQRLGVHGPYHWVAGIEGIKGRGLYIPAPSGQFGLPVPHGSCVVDCVSETGTHSPGDHGRISLRPFFEAVYDRCGQDRPAWMNQ